MDKHRSCELEAIEDYESARHGHRREMAFVAGSKRTCIAMVDAGHEVHATFGNQFALHVLHEQSQEAATAMLQHGE